MPLSVVDYSSLGNSDWNTISILAGFILLNMVIVHGLLKPHFINISCCQRHQSLSGFFVYTIVVAQMQHFSGWAGIIALALLQIPIVIHTTENMLKLVPDIHASRLRIRDTKWKDL